jgi:hypothetical protein
MRGPGRRPVEWWSYQHPGLACRLAEGHLWRGKSPSGGCAWGLGEW